MLTRVLVTALFASTAGIVPVAAQVDVQAWVGAGEASTHIVAGKHTNEQAARHTSPFEPAPEMLLETYPASSVAGDTARPIWATPADLRRAIGQTPPTGGRPSWVRRHPVAFGAIVGAVAGAVIVHAAVHEEASPIGFFGGAGAGAVVGWAVSR